MILKKEYKVSLAAARVNAGFTQEEVASRLNKGKQTIVNWEKGNTIIDMANFNALCELYNAPKEVIFLPSKSS